VKGWELVELVVERERQRMLSWLGTWVGTEAATAFAATMTKRLWYSASAPTTTQWGPLAGAYGLVRPALRQHMERKGSYLPVNALKFLAKPTEGELERLCVAHVMVGECCVLEGLTMVERELIAHGIAVKYNCVPAGHTRAEAHLDALLDEDVVRRLRLQLDMREISDVPHLGWLTPAYTHELDRSKRWISSIASGERGY
jgi:hypothetical protein